MATPDSMVCLSPNSGPVYEHPPSFHSSLGTCLVAIPDPMGCSVPNSGPVLDHLLVSRSCSETSLAAKCSPFVMWCRTDHLREVLQQKRYMQLYTSGTKSNGCAASSSLKRLRKYLLVKGIPSCCPIRKHSLIVYLLCCRSCCQHVCSRAMEPYGPAASNHIHFPPQREVSCQFLPVGKQK